MSSADRREHWQDVYGRKGEADVSWFQAEPEPSLTLLGLAGATPASSVIDIGGGAARFVDALLERGYTDLTVLDLSEAALAAARARIGSRASQVEWVAADVTAWEPTRRYDVWHDRAAFHFLTDRGDQDRYMERLRRAVVLGGHVIIGTFAPEGPERCSGLPVMRHDMASLADALGADFTRIDSRRHVHATPWGSEQQFHFGTFRREA